MERGEAKRQLLGSAMVAQSSSRAGPRRAARSAKGGGARARAPSPRVPPRPLGGRFRRAANRKRRDANGSRRLAGARSLTPGRVPARPLGDARRPQRRGRAEADRRGRGAPCWLWRRSAGPSAPLPRGRRRGNAGRSGLPAARPGPAPDTGPVLQ